MLNYHSHTVDKLSALTGLTCGDNTYGASHAFSNEDIAPYLANEGYGGSGAGTQSAEPPRPTPFGQSGRRRKQGRRGCAR